MSTNRPDPLSSRSPLARIGLDEGEHRRDFMRWYFDSRRLRPRGKGVRVSLLVGMGFLDMHTVEAQNYTVCPAACPEAHAHWKL